MADSKTAPAAAAPGKDAPAGKDGAAKAGAQPAGKKRNLKPIIMIAAAVVLLGGGAAAFFLLRPTADAAPEAAEAKGAAKDKKGEDKDKKGDDKKGEVKKPSFVEFDMFTVNLKDPEKFLQIKLTFQVKSETAAEGLKELMPLIRSAVIPVLSSQEAAQIMTVEGKDKMIKDVVVAANQSVAATDSKDAIENALITHMIIQ